MASKTTEPWNLQFPAWTTFAAFAPWGDQSFAAAKPQMYEQVFGKNGLHPVVDPYRQYTAPYQPFDYLASNPLGRPGGPSAAEQANMNNSLYGLTAPLNLSQAQNYNLDLSRFTQAVDPTRGGGYGALTSDVFNSLGGQLPYPTAPQAPNIGGFGMPSAPSLGAFNLPAAPTLGAFKLPTAPSLPGFTTPNVGNLAYETYNKFAQGQPGFQGALQSALNPNIALPGQSIYEQVAGQRAQGGPLDQYVNNASNAVQVSADRSLAKQQADLASKYAAEGAYMSGPMLTALGEMGASSNADVANVIAQMRLNAAEGESNRQYAAGTTQYQTEYNRNQQQAQIQAQTAQQLAGIYGQIAAQTGDAQAQVMADAYRTQAGFLSSIYGTQTGALANAYGTQGQFASSVYGSQADALSRAYSTQGQLAGNIYGTQGQMYGAQLGAAANIYNTQAGMYGNQLGAVTAQQQMATTAATQRAQDIMKAYGTSYDQALQMANAEQGNQQAALSALQKNYYQPGANLLQAMQPYFGLPSVTTPQGGGFGDFLGGLTGSFAQGYGQGLGSGV